MYVYSVQVYCLVMSSWVPRQGELACTDHTSGAAFLHVGREGGDALFYEKLSAIFIELIDSMEWKKYILQRILKQAQN